MKVRWTIVVEGTTLKEMRDKANRIFDEWFVGSRYTTASLNFLEPIFLDVEMEEVEEDEDGVKRVAVYKAWASRNFEVDG